MKPGFVTRWGEPRCRPLPCNWTDAPRVAVSRSTVTRTQIAGYGLAFCGVMYYNYEKIHAKRSSLPGNVTSLPLLPPPLPLLDDARLAIHRSGLVAGQAPHVLGACMRRPVKAATACEQASPSSQGQLGQRKHAGTQRMFDHEHASAAVHPDARRCHLSLRVVGSAPARH